MNAKTISLLSGVIWGLIINLILSQKATWGVVSDIRWIAFLIAPLIGILIYCISKWSYKKQIGIRVLWSILTLYIASGLYGLIVGLLSWPLRQGTNIGAVIEPVLAFWWGITFLPFMWPLFPFSFLNHQIIKRYENKPGQRVELTR